MKILKNNKRLKWLFLDLNSFFASVEQQDNPHLRGRPVAVIPSVTDSTCAIAASYEAKAFGVTTGTKIFDAKKVCPDLQCVLARHNAYVNYHHKVFEEVENHLHVTKICSIDEAACQLMGEERTAVNSAALAQQVKDGLRQNVGECIRCSVGISTNPFLAKVASNLQKPDGLVVLEHDHFRERLFPLALTKLPGINVRIELRLNKAGIYTLEDFWNASPQRARSAWGSIEGERFWYKLHGYDIPDVVTQKRVVGHSRVLEPSLRTPLQAYTIARQLTVKAAARMRRYGMYARSFDLSVTTTPGKLRWKGSKTFSPKQDNFNFIHVLKMLWDDMLLYTGGSNMSKVAVCLYDLSHKENVIYDLFEEQTATDDRYKSLSHSMDKINARFGSHKVTIGVDAPTKEGFVGAKIAFTRIPDRSEFTEY